MKTIRKSLFETNSSSMHSVTVQDVKDKSHDHFEHDDVVTITLEYYARFPQKLLTTPETKLSYIVSYLICGYGLNEKRVDFILRSLNDFFNDKKDISAIKEIYNLDDASRNINLFQKLHDCVKSHTNAEFKFTVADGCIYAEGYEKMMQYFETHDLDQVIFNPDYIIVVDGDEYCKYDDDREEEETPNNTLGIYREHSISLLEDPTKNYVDEKWEDKKYDFGDELLLNNFKPKKLTFYRLQKILTLDDLEPCRYKADKNGKIFNGIIYYGRIISKAKTNYSFYRSYCSLFYGKPNLFQITEEIHHYADDNRIETLKILRKDGTYDSYSLDGFDVKVRLLKPRDEDGDIVSGFYLEFYKVK